MIPILLLLAALGSEELGITFWNTGPVPCTRNGTVARQSWENRTPITYRITKSKIWIGADMGAKVDLVAQAYRGDGNLINSFGWDHYADSTGPHSSFMPNDLLLRPGEIIFFDYLCQHFDLGVSHATTLPPKAHFVLWLWVREE